MSDKKSVAVFGTTGTDFIPLISEKLPDWDVIGWTNADGEALRDNIISKVEAAVISPDFVLTPGNFGALLLGTQLKLICQPWVGVDWVDPKQLPKGLLFCNASGHAAPISEYVMASILNYTTELQTLSTNLKKGDWSRGGHSTLPEAFHGDIARKTLGLIGYGEIGQAIAKRAHAFEMDIIAVARSAREVAPEPLSWIGTNTDLKRLCQESDYIVLTCDLNAETEGMINADMFSQMKPSCYVVNVARGEVIEEEAFFNALNNKTIAGATIDTWYRYPPDVTNPPEDPDQGGVFRGSRFDFFSLDNVTVSPHSAAHTKGADHGRYISVAESLASYAAGSPIKRHVITGTGDASTIMRPDAAIG